MVDIQEMSLHYFIHMCIVQASSVSTTSCIDHRVFIVSFLSKMNYFATRVGLFFHWKKKLTKRTKQFISSIKNLGENSLFNILTVFQMSDPAGTQYSGDICWVFPQSCNVRDIQGTFREYFKGKDFLISSRWKSCVCVKNVWFDNNKHWSFGKFQ